VHPMRGEGTAWIPACAGMTLWVVRDPNEHSPFKPGEAMALMAV
jgi:hypothetical protein